MGNQSPKVTVLVNEGELPRKKKFSRSLSKISSG